MTAENEKRFLLLMSSFVVGCNATKSKVLDTIENCNWANLSEKDLQVKLNRNELVWRNDFAFVRKHLEQHGYYVKKKKNNWEITNEGKKELKRLCNEVTIENRFFKVTDQVKATAKDIYPTL